MIPSLDPDSESDFQPFGNPDMESDPVKSGIITARSVMIQTLDPIQSRIFSLLMTPDPDPIQIMESQHLKLE